MQKESVSTVLARYHCTNAIEGRWPEFEAREMLSHDGFVSAYNIYNPNAYRPGNIDWYIRPESDDNMIGNNLAVAGRASCPELSGWKAGSCTCPAIPSLYISA